MSGARFTTITGADWAHALPPARARRRPVAVRARVFAGPACPVCGRPGLHREGKGGMLVVHGGGLSCWWPSTAARHPAAGERAAA